MKRASITVGACAMLPSAVLAALLVLVPRDALSQCCGDCNGDGAVTVDEIITAVNRALNGCTDDGICKQQFPATGQTTCWDASGHVIGCHGTGQDGNVRAGATLSYQDNGDGTITDLNTRLVWEKKSADGSIHDQSTVYTWPDAFSTFIGGLNAGGGFAGYTDWRLPNVKELESIINYQNFEPTVSAAFNANCAPGCTVTTCSCTQSLSYWSSTTYQGSPSFAWLVSFGDGGVSGNIKGMSLISLYVRAVRGGL